jgi:hypothetical protein
MATTVYPRPLLSTSRAALGYHLLMTAGAIALIVTDYRLSGRPLVSYGLLVAVLLWINGFWFRSRAVLKQLEQRQPGKPDQTMTFLSDLTLKLPLLQLLVVLAGTPMRF